MRSYVYRVTILRAIVVIELNVHGRSLIICCYAPPRLEKYAFNASQKKKTKTKTILLF